MDKVRASYDFRKWCGAVLFGSKNPFHKRTMATPVIKCILYMTSSREMIEAAKEFIKTGDFEWNKGKNEV